MSEQTQRDPYEIVSRPKWAALAVTARQVLREACLRDAEAWSRSEYLLFDVCVMVAALRSVRGNRLDEHLSSLIARSAAAYPSNDFIKTGVKLAASA
jgi:hypothetical protein